MESKICVICNTKKSIDKFYNKHRKCKQRNIKRSLKRHYENNDKISNQQKISYEKKEKNYYRNKVIDIQTIKNYIDPLLKYKIN